MSIGALSIPDRQAAQQGEGARSGAPLVAFALLATYGTFRWGTMLAPRLQGRLFVMLLLSLAVAGGAHLQRDLPRRWRGVVIAIAVLAGIAMLPGAGLPLSWLLDVRLARLARGISHGISTLPSVIVPYAGDDPFTAAVIVLGQGLLLLGSALTLGVSGRPLGGGRLTAAALPLIVLSAVPAALARPQIAYFHGFILFVLVAALVFSERLNAPRVGGAALLLFAVAIVGVIGAAAINQPSPWLSVARLTSRIGGVSGERFDWNQGYGPLSWPQTGAEVLTVNAPHAAYWKALDLDGFDGHGWVDTGSDDTGLEGVTAANLARYTETITVHVQGLTSPQLITAGYAYRPTLPSAVAGPDPGVWVTPLGLHSGERYTARVYAPTPSAAELGVAGTVYPAALDPYRTVDLPSVGGYGPVAALASRLWAQTRTPYAYLEAVIAYLRSHENYTIDPGAGGSFPLVRFLLHTHAGYCQQFAGAAALLLRIEQIPVRVAVGFMPGTLERGDRYEVTDFDAHAWDEVWFPGYGWVTFDPTPPTIGGDGGDALAGTGASAIGGGAGAGSTLTHGHATGGAASGSGGAASARRSRRATGGGLPVLAGWILLGLVVLALMTGVGWWWTRREPLTVEQLARELQSAFARCGVPLDPAITLTELERRLADTPAAAAYVASLCDARYAPTGHGAVRSGPGRAAVRRRLARGRGPLGRLRALLALPPAVLH